MSNCIHCIERGNMAEFYKIGIQSLSPPSQYWCARHSLAFMVTCCTSLLILFLCIFCQCSPVRSHLCSIFFGISSCMQPASENKCPFLDWCIFYLSLWHFLLDIIDTTLYNIILILTLNQMSVSFLASYTKNNKETPVEMMAESPLHVWGIVHDIMVGTSGVSWAGCKLALGTWD